MRVWPMILAVGCGTLAAPVLSGQRLRVEILRGLASNNNAGAGSSVTPAVRVTDAQGKPVSGVLVIFTAPPTGASVDFAGDGPLAHAETDESGAAIAPRIRPVGGNGPVRIEVVAEKGEDSAQTSFSQMNLGVGTPPVSREDLSVLLISVANRRSKSDHSQVSLRIVGLSDTGIPGAQVECTLRALKPSGESKELSRASAQSGPGGEAACEFSGKAGSAAQLVVRAMLGGQTATRYFRLNSQ